MLTGNLQQQPCPGQADLQSTNPVTLLYIYSVAIVILLATGADVGYWTGPLKQYVWLKQGFASIRPLLIYYHFYVFITSFSSFTCYASNNGSAITYLYIISTPLICINMPVITPLLPVIVLWLPYQVESAIYPLFCRISHIPRVTQRTMCEPLSQLLAAVALILWEQHTSIQGHTARAQLSACQWSQPNSCCPAASHQQHSSCCCCH